MIFSACEDEREFNKVEKEVFWEYSEKMIHFSALKTKEYSKYSTYAELTFALYR